MEINRDEFKLIAKKWRSRLKKSFIRLTYDWRIQTNDLKTIYLCGLFFPEKYS